jgi:rubredoxin
MFSKKKTECRVCGYRFTPERGNIYTAEEPRSMADMLTKAPTRFSAADY